MKLEMWRERKRPNAIMGLPVLTSTGRPNRMKSKDR